MPKGPPGGAAKSAAAGFLPTRHGLDLDAALGQLLGALGEVLEVLLERVARRPGGLHLDGFACRRLREGAEADGNGRGKRNEVLDHFDLPMGVGLS
jgi:hypothetical protein